MHQILKHWNIHQVVSETFLSLTNIGLARTISVIQSRLADMYFDLKYKTETVQTEDLESLQTVGENKSRGQRYQPTGALAFKKIFLKVICEPTDVFVDYGCGKGRTLLLAALHGYKKVRGIEFSPQLCSSAEKNIKCFQLGTSSTTSFQVICDDVLSYQLQNDETVFYFFHPFDDAVMQNVIQNIIRSLEEHPRRIQIVYYLPRHNSLLSKFPQFQKVRKLMAYGYECSIYCYEPPS
jgi:SAM-dependent methyltransferase